MSTDPPSPRGRRERLLDASSLDRLTPLRTWPTRSYGGHVLPKYLAFWPWVKGKDLFLLPYLTWTCPASSVPQSFAGDGVRGAAAAMSKRSKLFINFFKHVPEVPDR